MPTELVDVEKVFHFKLIYMSYTEEELKKELETKEYEYGFYTDIESDTFEIGLNEDVIKKISKRKSPSKSQYFSVVLFLRFQQIVFQLAPFIS